MRTLGHRPERRTSSVTLYVESFQQSQRQVNVVLVLRFQRLRTVLYDTVVVENLRPLGSRCHAHRNTRAPAQPTNAGRREQCQHRIELLVVHAVEQVTALGTRCAMTGINDDVIDPRAAVRDGCRIFRHQHGDMNVRLCLLERFQGGPTQHEVAKLVVAYDQYAKVRCCHGRRHNPAKEAASWGRLEIALANLVHQPGRTGRCKTGQRALKAFHIARLPMVPVANTTAIQVDDPRFSITIQQQIARIEVNMIKTKLVRLADQGTDRPQRGIGQIFGRFDAVGKRLGTGNTYGNQGAFIKEAGMPYAGSDRLRNGKALFTQGNGEAELARGARTCAATPDIALLANPSHHASATIRAQHPTVFRRFAGVIARIEEDAGTSSGGFAYDSFTVLPVRPGEQFRGDRAAKCRGII
ncbi:PPE-repeat proteins [Zymobacter palmae]|uniref:PPE-repeat proteins n=1 Tax=Zymobacter palmae TaxID=33074 RepID=A0A348HBD6_9GAMM|nr:PPE-repeat proteins [Zymobacter palmae]